jgi:DNA mismatch repair protein MutL
MRDCVLSVMRHQIRQAEDLFSYKGFRGEALASIAAIAHVEMKKGTQIEGSKFVSQDVAVLPKGTSFAVKISFQYSSTS